MGFFSALCVGCEHPLLSTYSATDGVNDWMTDAVAVKDGKVTFGEYDGYGSIGEVAQAIVGASCWHKACFLIAGSPTVGTPVSADAPDQGYFFDDSAHTMADPRTTLGPLRTETVICTNDKMAERDQEVYAFMVFDSQNHVYGVFLNPQQAKDHIASLLPPALM